MDAILLIYASAEIILSIIIALSNFFVILVYIRAEHIRTITNTYIFSLAVTDFLAGTLGIPITVYSVATRRPHSYLSCLGIHLILCILCTISTFHMLAMAFDKFISICCNGQLFSRFSRHTLAISLITLAWLFGTIVAVLPILWLTNLQQQMQIFAGNCYFTDVIDYRYLVYVIFCLTIIVPSFAILLLYTSILRRIRLEERQVKFLLEQKERNRRMRRRHKLIRLLITVVLAYGICWYPLYIINTFVFIAPQYKKATSTITLCAVVLSHFSCAINPIIYAYGMPGFKQGLQCLLALKFSFKNSTANSCYLKSDSNDPMIRNARNSLHIRPNLTNITSFQSFDTDSNSKWPCFK
uniref:G_PROTEIN_RECEP_F1_2 domain-containing protein n=1 Tax=Syphacia muris TaxID=451379 RepID=A0A0N5AX01_9BILA